MLDMLAMVATPMLLTHTLLTTILLLISMAAAGTTRAPSSLVLEDKNTIVPS